MAGIGNRDIVLIIVFANAGIGMEKAVASSTLILSVNYGLILFGDSHNGLWKINEYKLSN